MLGSRFSYFDPFMMITTIILMTFGVVAVWSAMGGGALTFANNGVQQAVFGMAGIAALLLVASIDYRFLGSLAWFIYAGGLVALTGVLFFGTIIYGAQRWYDFGIITVQPAEFGKIATLIALAWFISAREDEMKEFGNFVVSLLIVAVPAALVFVEPDLGSATCYFAIWVAMMVVAKVRKLHLFLMGLAAIPTAYIGWHFLMHDYQKRRLLIFLDPYLDPTGDGYNVIQAQISIGSGGLFGYGLEGGTQSRLDLLKVRESDFIFAHVSGMFGFIGMSALFVCYVVLLWRCIRVAEQAKDTFGRCLAIGVFGLLLWQAFINIGMNLGILPVTGITLPFVSQGASSVVSFLIAQGILQSILMRQKKLGFQPR